MNRPSISDMVGTAVKSVVVTDMHTHLFPPGFARLQMSGADRVLTYHYLIAEAFRTGPASEARFWQTSLAGQAEWIYARLVETLSPLSEAASGVLEIAQAFSVNIQAEGLAGLRRALIQEADDLYVDRVLDLAGVDRVVMTNDPFDAIERGYWQDRVPLHPRFVSALRLDPLINQFDQAVSPLRSMGYQVGPELTDGAQTEVRRFLEDWIERMRPVYCAISLADTFTFPDAGPGGRVLESVVLPLCAQHKLPLALMIGARRQVNPRLQAAGDSTGKASMQPLERLCRDFPENKFLVSLLSRENQHELIVTARKFGNLMPFGCWWFLNTDSLVEEITRMRLELIGPTFVAQHSDARVLEHLIYKWARSRNVVARVLTDKYEKLAKLGWTVDAKAIETDVKALFSQNFWDFVAR